MTGNINQILSKSKNKTAEHGSKKKIREGGAPETAPSK
jgi:hypothetical protein